MKLSWEPTAKKLPSVNRKDMALIKAEKKHTRKPNIVVMTSQSDKVQQLLLLRKVMTHYMDTQQAQQYISIRQSEPGAQSGI